MDHSTNLREQLDLIADKFEKAWRTGERPDLPGFLTQYPHVNRTLLLRELLLVEIEMRQSMGETPSLEEYCEAMPREADTVRDVFANKNTIALTANPAVETSTVPSLPVDPKDSPRLLPREAVDFLQPPQQPDEIGRLGGYRVLKVLGKGGMGVVFQAEDPQLQRQVALKTMKPSIAECSESKERFLREARAAAAINHDNVVTIHQVGEDGGVPFIAMEFLPGESLQTRLDREVQLNQAEVVRIGREVAAGLAAAHKHGLIHRDIKPDNVWLEAGRDRAKLLDFGLARAHEQDDGLTQSGMLVGTPRYMSPEQAQGEIIDPRSDLFSLGSVLYRMAAGAAPFASGKITATLIKVAQVDCLPIEQRVPQLQPDLAALIGRLLQKDPDDRLQSAVEVVRELAVIEQWIPAAEIPGLLEEPEEASEWRGDLHSAAASDVEPKTTIVTDLEGEHHSEQVMSIAASPVIRRRHSLLRSKKFYFLGGTGLALLLIVFGGLWSAGFIFRVETEQGTLVVNVADENFTAAAQGKTVTIKNTGTKETYKITLDDPNTLTKLQPGDYEFVLETDGGLRTRTRRFQISRGQDSVVEAWWEPSVAPGSSVPGGKSIAQSENGEAGADQSITTMPKTSIGQNPSTPPVNAEPSTVAQFSKSPSSDRSSWRAVGSLPATAPFDADRAKHLQQAWARYLDVPLEREIVLADDIELKLVFIPGGQFKMGSPLTEKDRYSINEHQKNVTLKQGYYLGETEVTQSEWTAVMGTEPWSGEADIREGPAHVATHTSWHDAVEFCTRLTEQEQAAGHLENGWRYALPTEAQWEYACRAGTTTAYYLGNDQEQLSEYAWFTENAFDLEEKYSHEVRLKKPNAWGLYDMHGNVLEWCRDWYRVDIQGGIDPHVTAVGSHRAIRGGSWASSFSACRSAARSGILPSMRNSITGFRVAAVPISGDE